jgi:acetyltransferase-like isoleucine patch superfamily enzyme
MHEPAQDIIRDAEGRSFIRDDWYPMPLPANIVLEESSYPDTSYSFTTFFSEKPVGFTLGYGSGNYGHGVFTTGKKGEIKIGKFVVLQCTRLVCNLSIQIKDHCMFSWGSVVTDSWIMDDKMSREQKRSMLKYAAENKNRHLEFSQPRPVVIKENVWVGFEAIILPGVTIGRGAVIGAKSIIDKDVPEYAVIVGNPGRLVRYLDATDTQEVKENIVRELKG